jgi:hypothetical protein
MTRELDSPGTRIRATVAFALATLARVTAIALAIPATLALIQVTGRVVTGEFLLSDTWLTDIIIVYVRTALAVFNALSPRSFNELDPTIQGLLVFIPNLTLVLLGVWSLIYLVRTAFKR